MGPLPLELVFAVLHAVSNVSDLLVCKSVCKQLRAAVESCSELQYKIELASAGMHSNPSATPSYERLRGLVALQSSWRTLSPKSTHHFSVPRDLTMYELQHGALVIGHPASDIEAARTLTVIRLPTSDRPMLTVFNHADLGFETLDFTMDPTQDLIASLAWQDSTALPPRKLGIHIRTLSKNTPHPAARHPFLTFASVRCFRRASLAMQIHGSLFGILVHYPFRAREGDMSTVKIWNWRTGEQLACISSSSEASILTFSFLSDDAFTCAFLIDMQVSIRVYTFNQRTPIPHPDQTPAIAQLVATLKLPTLCALSRIQVGCRSEPASSTPFASSGSNSYPAADTKTDPDARILVYTLMVQRFGANTFFESSLVFVLHASYLLSFASPSSTLPPRKDPLVVSPSCTRDIAEALTAPPVALPWSEWGPPNTRFFEDLTLPHWVCYTQASRVVGTKRILPDIREVGGELEEPRFYIRLLDFNRKVVRRFGICDVQCEGAAEAEKEAKGVDIPATPPWVPFLLRPETISSSSASRHLQSTSLGCERRSAMGLMKAVTAPTTLNLPMVFVLPVTSYLPYAEATGLDMGSDEYQQIPGVMIDRERLVITREKLDGTMDIEIMTF